MRRQWDRINTNCLALFDLGLEYDPTMLREMQRKNGKHRDDRGEVL